MHLDKSQLATLKKLSKKPIERSAPQYDPIVDYLEKLGLASVQVINMPGDYMYCAAITEAGKAYLYDHYASSKKSTVAIVISVVSAVFSIFSLILSVLPNLDEIIENWNLLIAMIFG